jgi:hypothetical protein
LCRDVPNSNSHRRDDGETDSGHGAFREPGVSDVFVLNSFDWFHGCLLVCFRWPYYIPHFVECKYYFLQYEEFLDNKKGHPKMTLKYCLPIQLMGYFNAPPRDMPNIA